MVPYIVTDQGELIRLFRDVVGIEGRIAKPIIDLFYFWLQKSGPEWTIDRLKNIKVLYLQYLAGNKDCLVPDRIKCKSWKGSIRPCGPFGALWSKGTSFRTVRKMVNLLTLHSGVVLLKPTKKQMKKFIDSAVFPRESHVVNMEIKIPPEIEYHYKQEWKHSRFDKIKKWTRSRSKTTLSIKLNHKQGNRTEPYRFLEKVPECNLSSDRHLVDFVCLANSLLTEEGIVELLWEATHDVIFRNFKQVPDVIRLQCLSPDAQKYLTMYHSLHKVDIPIVGSIGFIQEGGGKLRVVANPLRYVQLVLSKLHNYLMLVAKALPWDCTYDQLKGLRWAEGQLRKGRKLYAYDLSDATNTIPLNDQIAYLMQVGPVYDRVYTLSVKFLQIISRARWIDPSSMLDIRWQKGQPLGALSSFPLFAQLHGARICDLCLRKGLDPYDSFRVLGDDVVVCEEIAQEYHDFVVNIWGCDISESKSISSRWVTEFVSRMATVNLGIIRFPKLPLNGDKLYSPIDPLKVLRLYGKRGIKLVPNEFRYYVQVISSQRRPIGLGYTWSSNEYEGINPSYIAYHLEHLRKPFPNVLDKKVFIIKRKGRKDLRIEKIQSPSIMYNTRKRDLEIALGTYYMNEKGLIQPEEAIGSFRALASLLTKQPKSMSQNLESTEEYIDMDLSGLQLLIDHYNQNLFLDSPFMDYLETYIQSELKGLTSGEVRNMEVSISGNVKVKPGFVGLSQLRRFKRQISEIINRVVLLWFSSSIKKGDHDT